jgi:transitional endoplasmic reticulum ATPase
MVLADSFERDLCEDQLDLYKTKANEFLAEGDLDRAASAYRRCASLQSELAELEASTKVTNRRREAAEEYRSAAAKLEDAESGEDLEPTGAGLEGSEDTTQDGEETSEGDEASIDESVLHDPPELSFEDVGGMENLKQVLADKVIDPYERKELYAEYGIGPLDGLILYGPPGTGKTYITQALAGELG